MVSATAALLTTASSGQAAQPVPLPQPRPVEAPAQEQPPGKTQDAPAEPTPSPCRVALTDEIAIAPSIPAIHGPGACGGDDLVRLEAIVLADKRRVVLKPAATLRCTMAAELADWIRVDMTALAADKATSVAELDNFDSFECRGMNRVAGAKLSEHGRANAIDVRGLKFANGQELSLTQRTADRALRERVLESVCRRFTTVLGPGSDWYHEDHIHLDLAERRSGYRICQWNIYDPLPQVAPLMPELRPDDAPPRESAKADGPTQPDNAKPAARPAERPTEVKAAPGNELKPSASVPVPLPEPRPTTAADATVGNDNVPPPPPKPRPKRRRPVFPSFFPPFAR